MSETWCETCQEQTDWNQRDVLGGTIYHCISCGREEVIGDDEQSFSLLAIKPLREAAIWCYEHITDPHDAMDAASRWPWLEVSDE